MAITASVAQTHYFATDDVYADTGAREVQSLVSIENICHSLSIAKCLWKQFNSFWKRDVCFLK